jgi:hypothetical protein
MRMSMKKLENKPEIVARKYDNAWQVVAPVSSCALGETSRNLVDLNRQRDYLRWITVFVTKNRHDAKKWLDEHREHLLKESILYEK